MIFTRNCSETFDCSQKFPMDHGESGECSLICSLEQSDEMKNAILLIPLLVFYSITYTFKMITPFLQSLFEIHSLSKTTHLFFEYISV